MKKMKRLGILVFFDAEGIIDDYLVYLLDKIEGSLDDLIIICNGYVKDETFKCFNKYSSRLIKRENRGYDGGAYKDCFLNYLSYEELTGYDELILFNDTFFGPFYPFEEIFSTMDSRKIDFWGITRHPKFGIDEIRNEHLQSYFLGIRNSILRSKDFYDFWRQLGEAENFQEAVDIFEISFTSFFEERGYKWDCYVNSRFLDNIENLATNYNHNHYKIYELIKEHRHPFIKKKDFSIQSDGTTNMQNALKYIDECTDYDVRLIWKTILRKCNLSDLFYCLNLNCVIPVKEISENALADLRTSKIGVIILINSDRYLKKIVEKVKWVHQIGTCYLFLKNKILKEEIDSLLCSEEIDSTRIVRKVGNDLTRKSVLENLISISKKNDYICFIHDAETDEKVVPNWVTDESIDYLFDNCLYSKEQISNVIWRFSQNQCLGILTPLLVSHSIYLYTQRNVWNIDFKILQEVCHMWGSHVDLNEWKYQMFNTDVFWCRANVGKELFENILAILKYIERYLDKQQFEALMQVIVPYMAQGIGYYTENMLVTEYAKAQMVIAERKLQIRAEEAWNEHLWFEGQLKIANEQVEALSQRVKIESQEPKADLNYNDYRRIVIGQIREFAYNNDKIYIYGTGKIAFRMYHLLKEIGDVDICGFVVSEGVEHDDMFEEMPIYNINELETNDVGIIVALNEKNTKEVTPNLKKNGYEHLYFYSYPQY